MDAGRRVSIFLPAFNEVDNLERSVADIEWAASQVLSEYEILIIDDGSTDGTGELAERLARASRRLRVPEAAARHARVGGAEVGSRPVRVVRRRRPVA